MNVISDAVHLFGVEVIMLLLVSQPFNPSLVKPMMVRALLTTLDWGRSDTFGRSKGRLSVLGLRFCVK